MNDQLTLADQYLFLGLKLKDNGRLRCMFCHVYAIAIPDGISQIVKVVHRPGCIAAQIFSAEEV